MKLNKQIPDLENRMSYEGLEFDYLKDKYRNIAFNHKHWDGSHNPGKYLFATEGFITMPKNYDLNFIKNNYKGLITPIGKIKELYNDIVPVIAINGVGNYNEFWSVEKEDHIPFSEKIDGVCVIQNIYNTGMEGDIVHLRPKIFDSISQPNFIKHSYGRSSWGGIHYQGHPHRTPSSPKNLETMMKYKFRLCLESTFHPLWSHDWVTERIFDCFKVKTIPIYWGCYNIEEKVPKELFIDLREFKDINEALNFAREISEKEYATKTELAFQFVNDCKIGNILEIEKILKELN